MFTIEGFQPVDITHYQEVEQKFYSNQDELPKKDLHNRKVIGYTITLKNTHCSNKFPLYPEVENKTGQIKKMIHALSPMNQLRRREVLENQIEASETIIEDVQNI